VSATVRRRAACPLRAAALLVAALAACSHGPRAERPSAPEPARPGARAPRDRGQVGLASYYGHRFHGRITASGAPYDMHAMTCAHRTAPFGTKLRVTDLESGRSVVVTVTDRGPFRQGRIVDLSLAAAKRLGMLERGLARVRVEDVR
jgi:rare lipoprotein A